MRRRATRWPWGAALLSALLLVLSPATAMGCTIDNVASLLADGSPAMRTASGPHGPAPSPWAPFTLAQALAAGATVRLAESSADLARTLPSRVRTAPYRWSFGDGGTSLGHTVVHRYAHPGTYRLSVWGYDRTTRIWFVFDAALVRVVPAGQVWRANLGYAVLRAVIALAGLTWPLNAVLSAGVLVLLARLIVHTHSDATGRPHVRRAVSGCAPEPAPSLSEGASISSVTPAE